MDFIIFLVSLLLIIVSIVIVIYSLIIKNKRNAKKASVVFAIGVLLFIISMVLPIPEEMRESDSSINGSLITEKSHVNKVKEETI